MHQRSNGTFNTPITNNTGYNYNGTIALGGRPNDTRNKVVSP
jgi:hypothetical protein